MNQVFISYRRELGSDIAKKIYDNLIKDYRVFFDIESMKNGRFDKQLEEAASCSKDLILIVTPNIFSHNSDEKDYLYKEIKYALIKNINIIPIFIDMNNFPEGCPEEIKEVKLMQGLRYKNSELFFDTLRSYLKCNNIYRLPITFNKKQYVLTDEGVDLLFDIYKKRMKNNNYEVEIDLLIDDSLEKVDEINTEDLSLYDIETSKMLIRRKTSSYYKKVIGMIELLLSDKNVQSYAIDAMHYYYEIAKLTNKIVTEEDQFGYQKVILEPLLWKDVINEILTYFSYEKSVRKSSYIGMDGVNYSMNWYFKTYVPRIGNDKLINALGPIGNGCTALINDIVLPERYVIVLVDLYWYMLMLKESNQEFFFKCYKENKFYLYNFAFGWC